MIRQPIIAILAHVDHGKTTLLDTIRSSGIAAKEAGGITQEIGATVVPTKTIKSICGTQLKKYGFNLELPGLLFIDTPGHEAFTTLRKRGGSIADLAVLLVDVNTGIQPQTLESIEILKLNKVPFIIAANKMDMVYGWESQNMRCFTDSYANQPKNVQDDLDNKIYKLIGDMFKQNINCELFTRVNDFTKQVIIVPISAKTGEGVPELLMFIAGLTQKYLDLNTDVSGPAKGTILEVKEETGLGTTIDTIIYDGIIKIGDTIVVGGKNGPITTKVRVLLQPNPLQEMREHKKFNHVKEVTASAGVKINAPGLEDALAGASVKVAENEEQMRKEIEEEMNEVNICTQDIGVNVKADSLGALEAIVKLLEKEGIPVKCTGIGNINRRDVIAAEAVKEKKPYYGVIFGFNVETLQEAKEEADEANVRIFETKIIYKMIEDYKEWEMEAKKKEKEEMMKSPLYPVRLTLLPGHVFRSSKPAIVGVRVEEGILKSPCPVMNKHGKSCGTIKSIQKDKDTVNFAEKGDEVAVSISNITIGRQVNEGDEMLTNIPLSQIHRLKNEVDEKALLDEIKEIKKKLKETV